MVVDYKMKRLFLCFSFICMITISACGNSYSNDSSNIVDKTKETQTAVSVKNIIIYAADVSESLKAIDRYSLSENGDIINKSYVFDSECVFYDINKNKISLNDFEKYVNKNYSDNSKLTQCRLVSEDKLVKEVYLEY
mgnify:FL=1